MSYALEDMKRQEQERLEAVTQAHLKQHAARKESLRPAFETAQFVGFSNNMPTNLPLSVDASLANFVKEDGTKFSLFIDSRQTEQLSEDRDYLVGFAPSHLHEHIHSPTAMQFFIHSMVRESPIMGNFAAAQPVPAGIAKSAANAGTTPLRRG